MRQLSLAALFCALLPPASDALALDYMDYPYYDIAISVDGWPKMGRRADGKLDAGWFSFATHAPQGTPTGKSTVQNIELLVPLGDPAVLFMRHALEGRTLKTVLVEGLVKGVANPASRAPFAVRFSDVRVSSVDVRISRGEAAVFLQASRVEVFTANPTATGAMQPGQQFGWDFRAGRKM